MKRRTRPRYWLPMIALTILCHPVSGHGELTDTRKKEIVYEMYAQYQKRNFESAKVIYPKQALELARKGEIVFVDVRGQEEMEVSRLPGAFSKEEFLRSNAVYDHKTVVAYCTIGYRSGVFAMQMAAKGRVVYNLAGGILGWVFEGGKIVGPTGQTRRVHVYGKEWNYLPDGYTAVMYGRLQRLFR